MTIPAGYRFEATQALRQVLARAVVWGMLDVNPAKQGVENPQRRRTEKRPFESWDELDAVAERLGPRYGPMVLFAAATGHATGRMGRARAPRHRPRRRASPTSTAPSARAAQDPQDRGEHPRRPAPGRRARRARPAPDRRRRGSAVPGRARRLPRPAQLPQPQLEARPAQRSGSSRFRRIYDLRHTFATFALRAGISTFDLSRYMGASLTMIDRHYGHLARDGREHAIRLLDDLNAPTSVDARGRSVDSEQRPIPSAADNRKRR